MIKKLFIYSLAFSMAFSLAGCTVQGPGVKIKAPKVVVPGVKIDLGGGCPPGQAKKGNC